MVEEGRSDLSNAASWSKWSRQLMAASNGCRWRQSSSLRRRGVGLSGSMLVPQAHTACCAADQWMDRFAGRPLQLAMTRRNVFMVFRFAPNRCLNAERSSSRRAGRAGRRRPACSIYRFGTIVRTHRIMRRAFCRCSHPAPLTGVPQCPLRAAQRIGIDASLELDQGTQLLAEAYRLQIHPQSVTSGEVPKLAPAARQQRCRVPYLQLKPAGRMAVANREPVPV